MNIVLMKRYEDYRDGMRKITKKMANIEVLFVVIFVEPVQLKKENNVAYRFEKKEEKLWQ